MAYSSLQSDRHATLHALLLSGDVAAVEAIVSEMLPLLERLLSRSFRKATRDAIVDAVEDALIDYIARPQRFDPQHWLRAAACCQGRLEGIRVRCRRRQRDRLR